MGRSKIIIFLSIIFICYSSLKSQGLFTDFNDKIYLFLDYCYANNLIINYDQFQRPLSRKQIAEYIAQIDDKKQNLSDYQKKLLEFFKQEYTYELENKFEKIEKIFPENNFSFDTYYPKNIIFFSDENNYFGVKSYLNMRLNRLNNDNKLSNAFLTEIGGTIYGSLYNTIGFELRGTNGTFLGNKPAAIYEKELKFNFKINELKDPRFFDLYKSYLSVELKNILLKIGSDRTTLGYGENKLILNEYSPAFNYLNLSFNYSIINFTYQHSWLLGERTTFNDSISGIIQNIKPKYFVNHHLSIEPIKSLKFGVGECVIYGDRGIELAYMIPFNFFKSAEHSLQDRDNTFLYFDFHSIPIKSTEVYATILFDDIDFSNWGNLYFNKYGYLLGVSNYGLFSELPFKLNFEYTRLNPYLYTHRINNNNYSNDKYPLGSYLNPNSDELLISLTYLPNPKFLSKLSISLQRHGENYIENNQLINVGGDLNLGFRNSDSIEPKFLDGNLVRTINIKSSSEYEILKNIKIYLMFEYLKKKSDNYLNEILFFSFGLISFI